ncbi:o-succinylbenzoate--CoA ligase [Neobacillus notoginsengisoli]|uniref:2-succinylbenzoate--CoA ligase n=1 Tax=Neobacillus notoginsengisoli TaxID=1578198 RepID=A0A417YDN1_9BACI|nr:o-succinylbenzoate--CoA ligase [Neobacillus notoginsengisoli]RHW30744.1 o-succinylbenzoate--CoA ligase [Neobacillus notoginsengisoli]
MAQTMPNFLRKRAYLTPERPAISYFNQQLSFRELYDRSLQVAGSLAALGVKKRSLTGVLVKNSLESAVFLYALQLLGSTAVMLNNRLSAAELSFQLSDAKAEFLIYEHTFKDLAYEASGKVSKVKMFPLEDLAGGDVTDVPIEQELSLDDVCTIMYTSGTTGNPKGVLQTYGNHFWSASASALNLGLSQDDTWLCSVPIFHISGFSILMRSVIYGMHIVLHSHFDAKKSLEDIEAKKVTIMSVVGTTLTRIVDELGDGRLPEHFRCMLLGGGPAPLPLLEACRSRNIPVFQTYGMTETASQSVTLAPEYSLEKLGSAGKPLFPVSLKIELQDGREAAEGEAGEILLKGPNVTPGYLNRPEETAKKIVDGWLHTGDIGFLDEEGFLYVLDRRSDLIISGGENIYPAEIESVLLSHPGVKEAGVTGLPNSEWGQVPAAFVVLVEEAGPSADELRHYCQEKLAKYKVPREFYFAKELPRNASNKLLRRKLAELIEEAGK